MHSEPLPSHIRAIYKARIWLGYGSDMAIFEALDNTQTLLVYRHNMNSRFILARFTTNLASKKLLILHREQNHTRSDEENWTGEVGCQSVQLSGPPSILLGFAVHYKVVVFDMFLLTGFYKLAVVCGCSITIRRGYSWVDNILSWVYHNHIVLFHPPSHTPCLHSDICFAQSPHSFSSFSSFVALSCMACPGLAGTRDNLCTTRSTAFTGPLTARSNAW